MRPGEPFNLKTEDIDLKTGDIFIRKSKRGKDRHIIVSDDMRDLCTVYNGLAGKREWFFQYPDGGQIPTRWAQWHFPKHGGRALFSPEEIIPDHMTCGTTLPLER